MKRSNAFSSSEHQARSWWHEAIVMSLLVTAGVVLRLAFRDLPNFAPVAALAMFAGYYFRSARVAVLAPVSVMLITDAVIGSYQAPMMILVYGMLALPVCLRGWLRHWCRPAFDEKQSLWRTAVAPTAGLIACGLGASLAFFAVTNFGVWLMFNMYEPTLSGLGSCYLAALPFFRYTLTGDLIFSAVFFGSYACVSVWQQRRAAVGCPV